ncbi:MAG: TIGR04282 family arsenosugar biosynthesis glycosyltransferase [Bacteroidia bacterium]|nr:TIGR04282 family arsenosugar biosynthesis glycosyltransferase [Bacteroidia bacterium]MBT8269483.1 TIGR04282 family arsenosugar biosynthesis glycosyltransferase [Bacteroidia bacterium]MBT8288268.1 TIGR04282 family arsenosugar biosynthesis glycosyltransferase [Bacteroidia bacterium]NNK69881.1 glycosyltransferase [Flavobacteriaceae bacterium]NNL79958.1 glycosyltransferase [Flavobacteriaceae bacterium]
MTDSLLIVFTKNLVEGKVKTRLAKSIGDRAALQVYTLLLEHTKSITADLNFNTRVGYSEYADDKDTWNISEVSKFIQQGSDLGERMKQAFEEGFKDGFRKVILIGGDCFNLKSRHLKAAFDALDDKNFVFGPALDGGYYLIGMRYMYEQLFQNKSWGTDTVLKDTLEDLKDEAVFLLEPLNDIDTLEDLKACQPLLNQIELND